MALTTPAVAARHLEAEFPAHPWRLRSCAVLLVLAASPLIEEARAQGIAGNRFFPGTLTFDGPAVADEAIVPNFSFWNHPDGGGNVTDNRINYSFIDSDYR